MALLHSLGETSEAFWDECSLLAESIVGSNPIINARRIEAKYLSGYLQEKVNPSEQQVLLSLLRLKAGLGLSQSLLVDLSSEIPSGEQHLWLWRQYYWSNDLQYQAVLDSGLPLNPHALLRIQLISAALWLGDVLVAEREYAYLHDCEGVPGLSEIRARLYLAKGMNIEALNILAPLLESGCSDLSWELAFHLLQQQSNSLGASTLLNRSLVLHPKSSRLHARQSLKNLLTRRPAIARRHALLQRLYAVNGLVKSDQERSDANLCTCYEHAGRCDFLPCLHADLRARFRISPQALANQALQLAALSHPAYPEALQLLVQKTPCYRDHSASSSRSSRHSLRVGFISPDFCYHPVGRFVAMMLCQGLGLGGDLHLVASGGREDPTTRLLVDLADQQGSFHNLKGLSQINQLDKVRELKLDIAVDLAGWTGDNSSSLIVSRVAPIQVNYLGYFASTGIPAMDFWLGDAALFPEPMQEWHSEQIWRLPRCFLAWQPSENLPEGQVDVPAAPAPSIPITFGSFNHARKLSAGTLRLWGELLRTVPGSRLALKSYTTDDPGTVQLLRQRMLRCGLDPERVLWLPTCPTAEEHLRQYGLVDIALDPFPNGGCTTTCEALWMGVPVITLRGDHYVSRMSTAVLQGAGMPEWIAASESEYLALAQRAAAERSNLRQTRANWRLRLQRSPLGDAAGLNQALWQAFAAMPAALKAG